MEEDCRAEGYPAGQENGQIRRKGEVEGGDVLNEERNVSVLRVKFWHVSDLRKQK